MKLVADGDKTAYFVLAWEVNGQPMTKTVSSRGEVFSLVRSLRTIGVEGFTIQRTQNYPMRVEE